MSTGGGDTTADEDGRTRTVKAELEDLALVIAFSAEEPERVGEVAFVGRERPGPTWLAGRGPAREGEPAPKLEWGAQRPFGEHAAAPLAGGTLSRSQLSVRNAGDALEVENIGRRTLLHNGRATERARVEPGDLLQLGGSLLLLCERRPRVVAGPGERYRVPAFGAPDEYGIVGESPAIWKLRKELAYVAAHPGHVLLLGPSGSGKELAANALHALSPWHDRPLVARNAATIPEGIADAELFGNARNYPNGGMPQRKGLVGEAHGSTLFLDEFAELSPAVQARLLRVLDAGEYQPLGEAQVRRSSFRLVAATNRPESALKLDLAARFRFRIRMPDLNARRSDIPLLLRHLRQSAARAYDEREQDEALEESCESIAACLRRSYTTHVRELARIALGEEPAGAESTAASTPETVAMSDPASDSGSGPLTPAAIQAALDRHNGAIEATWRALGLKNRHVLMRLVAKHGLEIRRRARSSRDS